MNDIRQFIISRLQERHDRGLLRELKTDRLPHDFCSNDYLGFARNQQLHRAASTRLAAFQPYLNGSGGSRLLSGNSIAAEEMENLISRFHGFEAALLFNSGYDANLGVLSSLPQRGDTVLTDELIHASLIDGARLSHAARQRFAHNDPEALEARLQKATGRCYVVVESIYSMDGDIAPLKEMAALCGKYGAALIVDEAHAIGVAGPGGRGLVAELGLQNQVLACVYTFGKALGVHGAVVCGGKVLRSYLLNFARSFIYTTAPAPHTIASISAAYQLLEQEDHSFKLLNRTRLFDELCANRSIHVSGSAGAIRTLVCPGNEHARDAAAKLQQAGFDVRAILSPTVPPGAERLRICLHTFNSDTEITGLVENLARLSEKNL